MITARPLRVVAMAALMALIAACASGKKKSDSPVELGEIQGSARIDIVWRANLLGSASKLRLGLGLAHDGNVVYAANHAGVVFAFDQATGKRLWRTATKLRLSAGPGVGDGLVVAGSNEGQVIALDAATGAIKWRSSVNSEILAAPAIAKQTVVLRAVDNSLVALRASDGSQIWVAEKTPPRLSLRGTARPSIAGDIALSGLDNGAVAAFQLSDGTPLWDTNVAPPNGRTDLERLNDIDSSLLIRGNVVYVVTFQGKVARLDLDTGQAQWSRDASSYSGMAADDGNLYITQSDGSVVKLINSNGVEIWKTRALAYRRLSPPALLGNLVAVADFEGYVHVLDGETGDLVGRIHALSGRVTTQPVVSNDTLFMLDDKGRLIAMRATPVEAGTGTTTPAGGRASEGPTTLRPR